LTAASMPDTLVPNHSDPITMLLLTRCSSNRTLARPPA